MHNILLVKAFEKAREEIGSNIKTRIANKLSNIIYEDNGQQYGDKILVVNYNKVKSDPNTQIELKPFVLDALSRYVGYQDYVSFANQNKPSNELQEQNKTNAAFGFVKEYKIGIIICVFLVIGFIIFNSINQQRWMVWETDHYEEVKFDAKKYNLGHLKLYDEERINDLKKITPDCDTHFFDSNGDVKIWYGKNINKELEYFTAFGLHPETGKTLAPISVYMIRKYICKEY